MDFGWVGEGATESITTFTDCGSEISITLTTESGPGLSAPHGPWSGNPNTVVIPNNQSVNSNTQIVVALSFSVPLSNVALLVVDIDENTSPNYADPEEFLSNFLSYPVNVDPAFNDPGNGTVDSNTTGGPDNNVSGWIDWSGQVISEIQFIYNRSGSQYGLILQELQFDCPGCPECDGEVLLSSQSTSIPESGMEPVAMLVNSNSQLVRELQIGLVWYNALTNVDCFDCDISDLSAYGSLYQPSELLGVNPIFFGPSGISTSGEIRYHFSEPVELFDAVIFQVVLPRILNLSCCSNNFQYCFRVTMILEDCTACQFSVCNGFLTPLPVNEIKVVTNSEYESMSSPLFVENPLNESFKDLCEHIFSVSPNPAKNDVYLTIPSTFLNGHLTILDGSGRVVINSQVISSSNIWVDVSSLSNGPYLARINVGNEYFEQAPFLVIR